MLATTAKRLNLSCGGLGTWQQKLGEKHRHMERILESEGCILYSMRQPLGLGLASGVVAADGAIAMRRRATAHARGLGAGSTRASAAMRSSSSSSR
jgi:hypothetical protein